VSLAVLQGVALHFGARTIMEGVDLRIGEGERIGLIGPNGSGKSTMLKILAGQQEVDGGEINRAKGVRVGYLPQDLALEGGRGIIDFVLSSVPGRDAIESEISEVEAELTALGDAATRGDEAAIETMTQLGQRLAELHERAAHFDTFFSEHEAMRILHGLGFDGGDRDRDIGELSGGWKMRVVLTGLLFQRPDLLLMDEPTNHLDVPSVAWLSSFLRRYDRSFVLISHDREFLNAQIDRVVSFEPEGLRQYKGNYDQYERQRAEEEIILENKARNLAKEREKAEQFITRFRAQANKAKAVQSRVKALEKMEEPELYEKRRVMGFSFPPTGRTSNEVMRIEGLTKAYGEHQVLDGVDLSVMRGDRIGIIGVNGAGKTTLLKMLAGELSVSSGEIRYGSHVKPGYYAQHQTETLDFSSTVFDEVARHAPDEGQTRVRGILGAFLFSGEDADKPISVLSGGERSRVALARLLIRPGNLILMDEPTNHLDLASSETLADSLATFDGTILFVSHNLGFMRKLATKIWDVRDGTVRVYPGTLDEYIEASRRDREGVEATDTSGAAPSRERRPVANSTAEASPTSPPSTDEAKGGKKVKGKGKTKPKDGGARRRLEAEERKLRAKKVRPLEREVSRLEAEIGALEAEHKGISTKLADPAVYEDPSQRRDLIDAYQSTGERLEDLTARWEIAQAELEAAEAELASE